MINFDFEQPITDTYEYGKLVSTRMPYYVSQYFTQKLWSIPPIIRPLNKNDTIVNSADKRIKKILKKNNFKKFLCRLETELSVNGRAFVSVENGNGFPFLQIADSIVRHKRLLGELESITVINNFLEGTFPFILTTTYTKKMIYNKIEVEQEVENEAGVKTKEWTEISSKDFYQKSNIDIHQEVENQIGIVPGVLFENLPSADKTEFGYTDLFGMENILDQMDIIWNKIQKEIIYKTTIITVNKNIGGGIIDDNADKLKEIELYFKNDIQVLNTNDDTYEDGEPYTIVEQKPNLEILRKEYNALTQELDNRVGIKYSFDKEGSFQEDKGTSESRGDSAFQKSRLKKSLREENLEEVFEIVKLIDIFHNKNKKDWNKVEEINIDVQVIDIRKTMLMRENPDSFLKIGYTKALLLKESENISIEKAKQIIKEQINDWKLDPMMIAAFTKRLDGSPLIKDVMYVDEEAKKSVIENGINDGKGTNANDGGKGLNK